MLDKILMVSLIILLEVKAFLWGYFWGSKKNSL